MSDPDRPTDRQTDTLPPGADRFWGQFSQTKAGRTSAEDERSAPEPEPPREEGQHCLEWCPICRSAELVRATAPPDAFNQVQAIQNEAIGVLKSFLAIYAERTGQSGQTGGPDSGAGGRAGGAHGESRSSGESDRGENAGGTSDADGNPPVRDISIE